MYDTNSERLLLYKFIFIHVFSFAIISKELFIRIAKFEFHFQIISCTIYRMQVCLKCVLLRTSKFYYIQFSVLIFYSI